MEKSIKYQNDKEQEESINTLSKMIVSFKNYYPDELAVKYKKDEISFDYSYKELYSKIMHLAYYLESIGLKQDDKIAIFSDNRIEWLLIDLACQLLGIIDIPRASNINPEEISYIMNHAEIHHSFVESPSVFRKLHETLHKSIPEQKHIFIIEGEPYEHPKNLKHFNDIFLTKTPDPDDENRIIHKALQLQPDDLATIIYTSGTTGMPKGVMLSHANLISNIKRAPQPMYIMQRDIFLSILPTWHVFERTVEYIIMYKRAVLIYSKPISSVLLTDLEKENPQILVSVPRIWEGLYDGIHRNLKQQKRIKYIMFLFFKNIALWNFKSKISLTFQKPFFSLLSFVVAILLIPANVLKWIVTLPFYILGNVLVFKKIKKKLGNDFKEGVSGGGSLPPHIDEFFNSIGIPLFDGYGLTETSPVICIRNYKRPVFYTIGNAIKNTSIQIRDENSQIVPFGHKGLLYVKGPQVMQGYYKQPDITASAIHDGWLNTGDIAKMDLFGNIKITGRDKSTIVLTGGENVEPEPIEDKLKESPFIKHAVIVGQDRRILGVLIVPDFDNFKLYFKQKEDVDIETQLELTKYQQTTIVIRSEIQKLITLKNGFKRYELIGGFEILPNDFEPGIEMTLTLKYKRNDILDKYNILIDKIYKKNA